MLIAVLLTALVAVSHAQQSTTIPHPLSVLPASGFVTTGFFFPNHPDKHFPAGKPVDVAIGFHNEAAELYNVTAIMGSLNSPADFSMFIQNFTQQLYHQVVAAGSEVTLDFKFVPDHRLEPRDFVVALTVFYQDKAGQYYSNTFFNQTIEILEVKKLVDWELISMFMILAGLAAGVGYVIYTFMAPHLASFGIMKKGRKSKKVENTRGADDSEDWLKGTNYELHKKKRAAAMERKTSATK